MTDERAVEAIETTDEHGWLHRRCVGEVGENSKVIGGVLCRWWGTEEPSGVLVLNELGDHQQAMTHERAEWDDLHFLYVERGNAMDKLREELNAHQQAMQGLTVRLDECIKSHQKQNANAEQLAEQCDRLQAEAEKAKRQTEAFQGQIYRMQNGAIGKELQRWKDWSGDRVPDSSDGDVIAAYEDGTIVLDDGITTWNPLRACAFLTRPKELQDVELQLADQRADMERLQKLVIHCADCGADYAATGIEAGCPCRLRAVVQGLVGALWEGLRLYSPGSAGLWAEQARATLAAARKQGLIK